MYFPICDCERQKKDCKLSPWTCGKVNRIFLCSANAKLSYRAPGLAHSRQQSSRTLSAPTRVTELNIRIWQALHVLPPKGELSYIVGRKTPLLHATQVHQTWKCVENECLQGKKSSCVVEAACVAQIFSHRAFFWCIMLRGSLMTLIWDDKASCSPSSSLKPSVERACIKASRTVTFHLGAPIVVKSLIRIRAQFIHKNQHMRQCVVDVMFYSLGDFEM